MEYKRSERVAELLREEISQIITRESKDPLIGLVTVTHVKLTDDLKSARVYVSVLGDVEKRKGSMTGLERAKNWIRNELGQRIELKYIPELTFCYDETIDYAQKIEAILRRIHKENEY